MPRWVIYIRGGKGFATRTHILLDDDTRPMVFTSLSSAKAEAAKHTDARIEKESEWDSEEQESVTEEPRWILVPADLPEEPSERLS